MKKIDKLTRNTIDVIKATYRNINLPWVIGYSGGKDSTCTLQLIWDAISELPQSERGQKVYVIYSDTMVEAPNVTEHLSKTSKSIEEAAVEQKLPFEIHGVYPKCSDTFWVNLLGRGYPAPRTMFRWCTDRLKIQPANSFILDVASKHGETVVVLGARKDESSSRGQVLRKREKDKLAGDSLPRHSSLPASYVFTPIANWTTAEVWEYLLLNSDTPWGESNRDLAAMYKEATSGECPLVVDKTTPSCGNSRFGCWVCTVVEQNKSLENMVDKGNDRLEPLVSYRNMLMETTAPENKAKYRSYKRRNGHVSFMNRTQDDEVKIIRGPYKFEYRKLFFKMLLETQQKINKEQKGKIELITEDEIKMIRKIWITEENDWEDSVAGIFKETMGYDFSEVIDDAAVFGSEEMELLEHICRDKGVPHGLVARLIDKEKEFTALGKRNTLTKELNSILQKEWRSEEEVVSAHKGKQ
jgi:DNA sulfur modification protein DndC